MNAGAYGGEMKDVLQSCAHIAPDGTFGSFRANSSLWATAKAFIQILTMSLQS